VIITSEESVTEAALEAMVNTPDERLRTIMDALVRHLHAFAAEIRLTEEELEAGFDALIRAGKACTDSHNEVVLLSDVLGLSTLVCLMNNGAGGPTETAAALLGPFWRMNSPPTENGGSILRSPTPGPALFVRGEVVDLNGAPVAGVEADIWQASPIGMYENQDDSQADMNLRGKFVTDARGRFWFRSVKPAGYPVPTDGVAGDLLRAQKRHPFRPAHLHALLYKRGFKTLVTQVFVDDDANLESDVVFGVTRALIGDFRRHDTEPPEPDAGTPWYSLEHRFVLQPGEAKLPTPPIK
jgi:protocatechuate 3,4-dioxygenase beta subunit